MTAIHLSPEEKNYFLQYAQTIDALVQTHGDDAKRNLEALKSVSDPYKDFSKMLGKAAQTPL